MREIFLLLLTYVFTFISPPLDAKDITFYCKKALHKQDFHSISGVDYIYVINAKKDLTRFRKLKADFAKYDIIPYRFDAMQSSKLNYKILSGIGYNTKRGTSPAPGLKVVKSGKNLILEIDQMLSENSTYYHSSMSLARIARNLDYFSIIFDAYKSKYKSIWVMEDTAKVLVNPNIMTGIIIKLEEKDPNWDMLYTDKESRSHNPLMMCNLMRPLRIDEDFFSEEFYEDREKIEYPFDSLGLRSGAYSFILSRRAIKKIVEYYKTHNFFIPFETEIQIIPKMNRYVLMDEVVTNRPI